MICSTVKLGTRDLTASQTYDIVMPDCLRVSGTVTLASPLPDGSVGGNGGVNFFKIIRDENNRVSDMIEAMQHPSHSSTAPTSVTAWACRPTPTR